MTFHKYVLDTYGVDLDLESPDMQQRKRWKKEWRLRTKHAWLFNYLVKFDELLHQGVQFGRKK